MEAVNVLEADQVNAGFYSLRHSSRKVGADSGWGLGWHLTEVFLSLFPSVVQLALAIMFGFSLLCKLGLLFQRNIFYSARSSCPSSCSIFSSAWSESIPFCVGVQILPKSWQLCQPSWLKRQAPAVSCSSMQRDTRVSSQPFYSVRCTACYCDILERRKQSLKSPSQLRPHTSHLKFVFL